LFFSFCHLSKKRKKLKHLCELSAFSEARGENIEIGIMSDRVIKVENLSKQYRIGAKEGYRTFRETLVDAAKAPFHSISKLLNRQSSIVNPRIPFGLSKTFPSKSNAVKSSVLSVETALEKARY